MSRYQRRQADPAIALNLNEVAACCNAACGGDALLWDQGKGAGADIDMLDIDLEDLRHVAINDKPGDFAQHLGELVFDTLALAGALGIDIAGEVERVRKRTEKAGFK